ncbi:MAG: methyltransferase domain-containing protein [Nanoarchaeota archaeon]
MAKQKENKNEFSKFFVSTDYIKLKNKLFNYRFRKYMLAEAYKKYSKIKDAKMLDVGCGISPVSPDYKRTTFIDSDKNAIDMLKKSRQKVLLGDVEKIPVKNEYADALFSSEVLEHVNNYKKGLKEFHRVLKKNGVLFLTVPTHMKYWAFDDDYVGHLRRFDPVKLTDEIKQVGFDVLEVKPIGSFIERELTKYLVKKAINQKPMKISKLKMKGFKIINDFLFGVIYLAYLLNNSKNSSIVMISARKK